MIYQGLLWSDLLDSIARRIREPDLFSASTRTAEQQTPYFDPEEAERLLYRVSLVKLRVLGEQDLEAIGPKAIVTITSTTGGPAIPLNAYAIAAASIQATSSDPFAIAEFIPPAQYLQHFTVPATAALVYTCFNGAVQFPAYGIRVVFRVEPTLQDFQNDEVILPAEHDEDRIDQVHKLMLAQDFMPMGRM